MSGVNFQMARSLACRSIWAKGHISVVGLVGSAVQTIDSFVTKSKEASRGVRKDAEKTYVNLFNYFVAS